MLDINIIQNSKNMKKLIRKIFRIEKKKNQLTQIKTNTFIGSNAMAKIVAWENLKSDIIIRSSFDRELYCKYLRAKRR